MPTKADAEAILHSLVGGATPEDGESLQWIEPVGFRYGSKIPVYATADLPVAGEAGRVVFDSTTGTVKADNGTSWGNIGEADTTIWDGQVVFPPAHAIPANETQTFSLVAGYLTPNAVTTSQFQIAFVPPVGTVLTDFSLRAYVNNAVNDAVVAILYVVSSVGVKTQLGDTLAPTSTGWTTKTSTSFSHTVAAGEIFIVELAMTSSAAATDSRFLYVTIN